MPRSDIERIDEIRALRRDGYYVEALEQEVLLLRELTRAAAQSYHGPPTLRGAVLQRAELVSAWLKP
jgi:hypothetical protein